MPRRKTNAEKQRRGTDQPCRRLAEMVVFPKPGEPPLSPEWLSAEAKVEWNRLAAFLTAAGQLSEADLTMLAVACDLWGLYLTERRGGGLMKAAHLAHMRALYTAFGLVPMARLAREAPPRSAEQKWWDEFRDRRP